MSKSASAEQRRPLLIAVSIANACVGVGLSALGWGGLTPLLDHPARAGFVVLVVIMTAVALWSPINLSSGQREDVADRLIFLPTAIGITFLTWLMPFMDRRDIWTLDGDTVRYLGLLVLAVGGVLRIWPMFVLGHRFSGLVAIQPDHQLVTSGPYRYVRHPSYLGMMLGMLGWVLVFRSTVGLAATAVGVPVLLRRIDDEEALLASQFGAPYAEYCRRTWRLLPGIY